MTPGEDDFETEEQAAQRVARQKAFVESAREATRYSVALQALAEKHKLLRPTDDLPPDVYLHACMSVICAELGIYPPRDPSTSSPEKERP